MAAEPLDCDGQNGISKGEGHGDVEQAKAPSPLRRALLRLAGGEPGVESIQPFAHHRTVAFRRAIMAQQITPICAITWVNCGVA